MKRIIEQPLVFPIGDVDYTAPPVGIDAGWQLIAAISLTPDQAVKSKIKSEDLFKLALSPDVYEKMRVDGVATHLIFRAGMAALAHFQVLAQGGTSEDSLTAAEAIWESGLNPEALAAFVAARQSNSEPSTTSPSTAKVASLTSRPANTSGTTSRANSRKRPAKPSTGSPSPTSGL